MYLLLRSRICSRSMELLSGWVLCWMVKCKSIIPQIKPKVTRKKPSFWEDSFHGVKRAIALWQLHLPWALTVWKGDTSSWCRLGLWVSPSHSGSCVSRFPFLVSILLWRRGKVSKTRWNKPEPCFHPNSSKMWTSFFLNLPVPYPMLWFGICKWRGEIWLGDEKLYKYGGGKCVSARVHRCSRAVPVWTKFKTGSLFCKVEEMEGYFTECQQKPKWRVESHHHPALLCLWNLNLQSHHYVL